MKKLISILLALVFVLSMATVTFAETQEWDGEYAATDPDTFTIKKVYEAENGVSVAETLNLVSTPATGNPDTTRNLTFGSLAVSGASSNITVNVPSYEKAGEYNYTITETAGNTAGVGYATNVSIKVKVLVAYDNVNHKLVIGNTTAGDNSGITYIIVEEDGADGEKVKLDTFKNTFNCGSFTVAKNVDGNMANENDEFEIKVTLTSAKTIGTTVTLAGTEVDPTQWKVDDNGIWTYTHTGEYREKDGAKTFSNIPVGVVVTVAETQTADKMNGYTYTSTKIGDTDFTSLTVANDTDAAIVVTNTKTATVETGIVLDSMPYFVMLAVACAGMFLLVSKKRMMREN